MLGQAGVVVYRDAIGASAIDEYSRHLVDALRTAGARADYVNRGLRSVLARDAPPSWVLLQYNPFSYGRWGFAPGLVRDALSLRRRWPHTPLVMTVHEAWVPIDDWRSALMGAYQRAQLRSLLCIADQVIVARETLAHELGGVCAHIPVASNIEPIEVTASAARARLAIGDEIVVALFGTGHPDRALDHAEAAIAALATARGGAGLCVLNLGRDSPVPTVPPGSQIRSPGAISNEELSLHLRASDILLLPFTDGLSLRRTTLMAGLAHALPVLGLQGFNTDRVLVHHPDAIKLTPFGDVEGYATAAVQLARDPALLRATGDAAQRLYAEHFDWPLVAQRVLRVLRAGANGQSNRRVAATLLGRPRGHSHDTR